MDGLLRKYKISKLLDINYLTEEESNICRILNNTFSSLTLITLPDSKLKYLRDNTTKKYIVEIYSNNEIYVNFNVAEKIRTDSKSIVDYQLMKSWISDMYNL